MPLTLTRYITLEQLGEKLGGRSRSSIYRDLENGRIPNPIRIGSRLYWCEAEVDDFLKTRRLGAI
ncbi:helix-turn-helix transcriptional regulator [Ruegeria atlantica]|uniref:helix-turn-helix transcriptional regulator n=1 Tax=Ruegeria atlantica TaxID=81569 RepID=UPI001481140C|nr:AlpA family phage regulatory protein [Ruegeria atlantica]